MGKLQEQMKTDLLLKRYSPHTTRAYLRCIREFAKYFMRPNIKKYFFLCHPLACSLFSFLYITIEKRGKRKEIGCEEVPSGS